MDTVTSSYELKLDYRFTDDDTRTTTLANPRSNLTAADINSCSAVLLATQAFVGDKNNAPFEKITGAVIVEKLRTKLDLS